MSQFYSFLRVRLVCIFLIFSAPFLFANIDYPNEMRDCSVIKEFVQPVVNGTCYGTVIHR